MATVIRHKRGFPSSVNSYEIRVTAGKRQQIRSGWTNSREAFARFRRRESGRRVLEEFREAALARGRVARQEHEKERVLAKSLWETKEPEVVSTALPEAGVVEESSLPVVSVPNFRGHGAIAGFETGFRPKFAVPLPTAVSAAEADFILRFSNHSGAPLNQSVREESAVPVRQPSYETVAGPSVLDRDGGDSTRTTVGVRPMRIGISKRPPLRYRPFLELFDAETLENQGHMLQAPNAPEGIQEWVRKWRR